HRSDAATLRQNAEVRERSAQELRAQAGSAEGLEQELAGADRRILEDYFRQSRPKVQEEVGRELRKKQGTLETIDKERAATERELAVARSQLQHANETVTERRASLAGALDSVGSDAAAALTQAEADIASMHAQRKRISDALSALEREASE